MNDLKRKISDGQAKNLPFSFVYGGRSSKEIIKCWECAENVENLDAVRKLHTFSFKDPLTGLEVLYEAVEYSNFPAVEWVIHFSNNGKENTPVLENIQALDMNFTRSGDNEFVLHYINGSYCNKSDFAPHQSVLSPSKTRKLFPFQGRSSDGGNGGAGPFFDLEYDHGGISFAIGWSGRWQAEFSRDAARSLKLTAGMEFTHLRLYPGERIRSPRVLMLSWDGAIADGHNRFRQFILKYHTPQRNSVPVECPFAALSFFQCNNGIGSTEKNQIILIDQFIKNKIDLEYFWVDAGWYEGADSDWHCTGTWEAKKKAFPNGLKPVADHAKKNGMGFVLWFEPERVHPDTWLYKEHPEWLFMPDEEQIKARSWCPPGTDGLLNLGNSDALDWLIDHMAKIIRENGIDIYRIDFNFAPLKFWRNADAPDRRGISEIRYIEGLYAFWDELLKRCPGLIIDNCASGGRRIDLETISRSLALWRSDFYFNPEGAQCHTLGLNQYLPCSASSCNSTDAYNFRSCLGAGFVVSWDPGKEDFNPEEARQRIKEFKLLRPLYYGNFYSLTRYSLSSDIWCAYQLDRKDLNMGAVLVFRRKDSLYSNAVFKLHNLNVLSDYEFTDIDSGLKNKLSGKLLMAKGLEVKMPDVPASAIIIYKKTPNKNFKNCKITNQR